MYPLSVPRHHKCRSLGRMGVNGCNKVWRGAGGSRTHKSPWPEIANYKFAGLADAQPLLQNLINYRHSQEIFPRGTFLGAAAQCDLLRAFYGGSRP